MESYTGGVGNLSLCVVDEISVEHRERVELELERHGLENAVQLLLSIKRRKHL